jgi:hypothetical protein
MSGVGNIISAGVTAAGNSYDPATGKTIFSKRG